MQSLNQVIHYYASLPLLEWLAVLLSLAYVVLAAKQNSWCWPAAFISTGIYTVIFYDVTLFMDSLLNAYYLVMAVYGFWCWQKLDKNSVNHQLVLQQWSIKSHVLWGFGLLLLTLIIGFLLGRYTTASFPYLDSFTTLFAIFATYLITQKVLENWLYFIVIDAVSIYLYLAKGLVPTAALFVFYVVLAVWGYVRWQQAYRQQQLHVGSAAHDPITSIS